MPVLKVLNAGSQSVKSKESQNLSLGQNVLLVSLTFLAAQFFFFTNTLTTSITDIDMLF